MQPSLRLLFIFPLLHIASSFQQLAGSSGTTNSWQAKVREQKDEPQTYAEDTRMEDPANLAADFATVSSTGHTSLKAVEPVARKQGRSGKTEVVMNSDGEIEEIQSASSTVSNGEARDSSVEPHLVTSEVSSEGRVQPLQRHPLPMNGILEYSRLESSDAAQSDAAYLQYSQVDRNQSQPPAPIVQTQPALQPQPSATVAAVATTPMPQAAVAVAPQQIVMPESSDNGSFSYSTIVIIVLLILILVAASLSLGVMNELLHRLGKHGEKNHGGDVHRRLGKSKTLKFQRTGSISHSVPESAMHASLSHYSDEHVTEGEEARRASSESGHDRQKEPLVKASRSENFRHHHHHPRLNSLKEDLEDSPEHAPEARDLAKAFS
jgi:hypothetical protein